MSTDTKEQRPLEQLPSIDLIAASKASVAAPDGGLIVVANSLPVRRENSSWVASPGGLVAALAPIVKDSDGVWIGCGSPGDVHRGIDAHQGLDIGLVPLSTAEVEGYYAGFANSTLWPLFHVWPEQVVFRGEWWEHYQAVNRRIAEAVIKSAAPKDTIWVHDYHLMLVPQLVREKRPDLRVGFFLHIPFPPEEIFRRLPWRDALIDGLLGADVVGFQTPRDATHFLALVRSGDGTAPPSLHDRSSVVISHQDRNIEVGTFPISIDYAQMQRSARSEAVSDEAYWFRCQLGDPDLVFLGVDRLDYTKGIDARLEAFANLLATEQLDSRRVCFVQVAAPTRDKVGGYSDIRHRVERLVGEINGRYATPGRPVVHYLHRTHTRDELVAMYIAADIMVVTPFRDGMNLVAKEFVASRVDRGGALVISEFAGAASELEGAVRCNPYDIESVSASMMQAVGLSPAERRLRMDSMRDVVSKNTVHDWARTFLGDLVDARREVTGTDGRAPLRSV